MTKTLSYQMLDFVKNKKVTANNIFDLVCSSVVLSPHPPPAKNLVYKVEDHGVSHDKWS